MASLNEDDNIQQEETGRRTRSGRKVVNAAPPVTRNTRRSSRKHTIDQVDTSEAEAIPADNIEHHVISAEDEEEKFTQSDIIKEMLAEAAQGVLLDSKEAKDIQDEVIIQEPELSESDFKIDDIEMVVQTQENEEIIPNQDDEKSSSFPFGNPLPSENSDGKTEENVISNIAECVDSSLLASLVGDNANSLPSVGEESQSKENFEVTNASKNESVNIADNNEIVSIADNEIAEVVENNKIAESAHNEIIQTTTNDIEINDPVDDNDITDHAEESVSQPAIAEDFPNGETESEKTAADIDAEIISEDELPTPTKPKVTDAEEVSDDELPAPKRAELPADTEVVSEDELPSSTKKDNKRKASEEYNPNSPTEESTDIPEKRQKIEEDKDESKDKEKRKDKEKKKLPELDKYWKAVNDDPADFTGWTYLLQYVDQENDIDAAREAYDAFLAHYPYCYGYWRKYADYEKRKGNKKKCEEVFERGLKAIPLSVDLWIHYLTHVKTTYSDNEEYIRSQFERALVACGLEFRSDKLWEAFIKWEIESKRYSHVVRIYDRLLAIPTQGYNGHFDSFQDLINNHPAPATVGIEEFKKLRAEVRETEKSKDSQDEVADPEEVDDHVRNEEEMTAIKEKIIASRRKIHKATISAVTVRWIFEEGIKRPYFHVKPLERCQLKNWKEYLDFEIEKGDRKRILILFERCLIACALYDEFWLKLIRYLESQNDPELTPITRDAFERACTIHHPEKPSLHLMWSAFEECQNNFNKAAEILTNLEKICPSLLQIAYRRLNLERRRGDFKRCQELYEHYITNAKNKNIAGSLSIKYARFCHKVMGDLDRGFNVLKQALEKDSANTRVALQMIDMALQREKVDEAEVVQIMDKFTAREGMDPDQKVLFAQRKVEFLEDFGNSAKGLQDAQRALQIALSKANEAKKKSESSPNKKSTKDTITSSSGSVASSSAYNNSNYGYGSGTSAGYYGNNQSYQSYDSYGYNHWQYGSGYGGYGQWSGYGNYY